MKLTGWRDKMYPLAIYAGDKKIWEGYTYPTLGYCHLKIKKSIKADQITIKMIGNMKTQGHTGDTTELAGGKAGELDQIASIKGKINLRIVEIDFLKDM